jgi:anti-anti-sigma regulatory factor
MLRITNTGTTSEQKLIVCGRLTGPWVGELRSNWERARLEADGRKCVVDISDVTFIDGEGEELLHAMKVDGARFVARGVDTKHLLGHLKARGKRPLRKFLTHLPDPCGHP